MKIGLIGCGNMARAMARGWGEPVLCFDPVSERAEALARETGGEALDCGLEVAKRTDLLVLCHKPAQLESVAQELAPVAKAVASILAATPLSVLREAYPGVPVFRFLPSLPAEVRAGAIVKALDSSGSSARVAEAPDEGALEAEALEAEALEAEASAAEAVEAAVDELFGRLGVLVALDESLVDVAMGLMSCAPAYVALVAEAQVDAGVRRGIPPAQASALVTETLAGTAELLRRRGFDTLAVRREVTSPGGITARGLAALEAGGIRAAFSDALDAVLGEQ
ncbi:MAG TPA: pyrroline-5-carboxylate reductase dimerization domain-containing protein [Solirubrobacteraceae bacterium]|jgi:pyrroline-5-carboxylate reductase|nr:pyrroline-5-carboxylate reductase dimerization domain-containing protein [Solirubrobacteraceae bacterium]